MLAGQASSSSQLNRVNGLLGYCDLVSLTNQNLQNLSIKIFTQTRRVESLNPVLLNSVTVILRPSELGFYC